MKKRLARLSLCAITVFTLIVFPLFGCNSPSEVTLTTSCTPNNGGTVSPSGGTYKNGAEITLIATPSDNYKFNGWAGDISDSTDRVTVKMNSDKNIVASFARITRTIQLNVNPPGSGTLDPSSGNYEAGIQVKITATPSSGYRFDHWGGSATSTANPLNIMMDTNKTITAYFTRQYTLKIEANPLDGGSITPGTGLYDAGTQVKLTATQIFPYAFTKWTGTDNDNIFTTTVTMDSDKSVTCNFTKLTPGEWKEETFPVYRGGAYSFYIELNQFEYAEGEIMKATSPALIQDPTGTTIKDFGATGHSNFLITALIPGRHTIIFYNYDQGALKQDYTVKYRIYRR